MILDLFAVEAVVDIAVKKIVHGNASRHGKRNSLVCRTEKRVNSSLDMLLNIACVIFAQLGSLCACLVIACIDEIRGLSAALGSEVAEKQNAGTHHKFNKILFI